MSEKKISDKPVGRPRRIEDSASVTRGFRVHPDVPRSFLEEVVRIAEKQWLEKYGCTINGHDR